MKPALILCLLSALLLGASVAVRLFRPVNLSPRDPALQAMENKRRSLAGFSAAIAEIETKCAGVRSALWSPRAVEAFLAGLPSGWVARPIDREVAQGIALHRYAFSKDATLRDFQEFQRVLRKLEERPGTRIDTITLALNPDGRRFATALITATIPVSPQTNHEP